MILQDSLLVIFVKVVDRLLLWLLRTSVRKNGRWQASWSSPNRLKGLIV
jgi:hypothetical protein